MGKTLFDKVWDSHVIERIEDGPDVLFIDKHFIHEVTSPVAFVGLKNRNLKVMYPHRTFAQLIITLQQLINIYPLKIDFQQCK